MVCDGGVDGLLSGGCDVRHRASIEGHLDGMQGCVSDATFVVGALGCAAKGTRVSEGAMCREAG
jgi:hypothetical protein